MEERRRTRKVLITGGFGLVGRILWHKLTQNPEEGWSYDVYVLDKNKISSESMRMGGCAERVGDWMLPQVDEKHFFQADILDYEALVQAFQGMDMVVHLAAALEMLPPEVITRVNIEGPRTVYKACLAAGVKKVVHTSSIMVVYKWLLEEPYSHIWKGNYAALEDDAAKLPLINAEQPVSIDFESMQRIMSVEPFRQYTYTNSKIEGEGIAKEFGEHEGCGVVIMRLGWVSAKDTPYPNGVVDCPSEDSVWLSHRDAATFVEKCMHYADTCTGDHTFFGVADNKYRWVDTLPTKKALGWQPLDSAEMKLPAPSHN